MALAPFASKIQRDGFVQIRVAGTPFEMGLQHGELLRHEIRSLLDAVYHHVLYGQPGIIGWGMRRAVRTVTAMLETQIPTRYRTEMEGIARGADLSYHDVLLISCFDDVLANLRLLGALFGRLGCSAFALTPERTGGDLLAGRNLDYFVPSAAGDDVWAATQYMKESVAVIEHHPAEGNAFVSVGWPGFTGGVTAMSARGMVTSALTVLTLRDRPFATPSSILFRRIVEETSTLHDALSLLRRSRRSQGNNLLLASGGEGQAAVVEFTPSRLVVRRPQDGWIATTNHFNHPAMVGHHAGSVFQSTTERLARLGELCAADLDAGERPESLTRFLLDVQRLNTDSTEYCTVWNPCTIYSTVFAPAEGRLWVRVSDRSDRSFEEIHLGSDGSQCVAPPGLASEQVIPNGVSHQHQAEAPSRVADRWKRPGA
jgi:hypothetical protein